MIILGIETSADETGVAIVKNGTTILSNIIATSAEMQNKYGGIYPEVAARKQLEVIIPVLKEALSVKGDAALRYIDAIAVTTNPGLIGSLLVGVETAKTLAFALNKPIIPVNHVIAHLYANWITNFPHPHPHPKLTTHIPPPPQFPAVCLIVSGGHTILLYMKNHGELKILGQTRDDAAGEAFDKTARLLGLSYPGGPAIQKSAEKGNPKAFNFPRGMIGSKDYDFSFSGLKTAVLREVKKINSNYSGSRLMTNDQRLIANLCASIQEAIVDVLVSKTIKAVEEYKPKSVLLSGGVASNLRLREKLENKIVDPVKLFIPPVSLCTDNAAVIASYAFFNYKPISWKEVQAKATIPIFN